MSHFTTVKSELRDCTALVEALYRSGYGKETVKVNKDRTEIKVQGNSYYDRIEFTHQKDGTFSVKIDDMYKKNLNKITNYYTAEVIKNKSKEMHFHLMQETEENGEITLKLHSAF